MLDLGAILKVQELLRRGDPALISAFLVLLRAKVLDGRGQALMRAQGIG